MAKYFRWIFDTVHTQGSYEPTKNDVADIILSTPNSQRYPWYVVPPPANYLLLQTPTYNPSTFPVDDISSIIIDDLKRDLHFSMKMENTGDEGLYGLLNYCHFPELELGLDIDIASFIAGAVSCTLLGLYFDDIYRPRKLMVWWPTRWFFHFLEEGIYLGRSCFWFGNAAIIVLKTFCRVVYGGMTHTVSRMLYYWFRKLLTGNVPYTPLVDDTLSALLSGYMWTSYTLKSEEHTAYDSIICSGWSAVFTGLLEYCLFKFLRKEPPPGLFRWIFGGAFYGPGAWLLAEGTSQ